MGNGCGAEEVGPDTIKLEYFKAHGRAEPIRAMLHHANVHYVD